MNVDLNSLQRLGESQYSNIGKMICLLSTIEYELLRTIYLVKGVTEDDKTKAARCSLDDRKNMLRDKLQGDNRINESDLDATLSKLDTASKLRNQFAHGLWMTEGEELVCKFIKRNKRATGAKHIALQTIKMPPQEFALIHRNLEYILIELDVMQELLVEG